VQPEAESQLRTRARPGIMAVMRNLAIGAPVPGRTCRCHRIPGPSGRGSRSSACRFLRLPKRSEWFGSEEGRVLANPEGGNN
jgi:hypothetical protein